MSLLPVVILKALLSSILILTSSLPLSSPTPASAPSASPSPALPSPSECVLALSNSSDCLSYISPGSKDKQVNKKCCEGLSSIVSNTPKCLCFLLFNSSSLGVEIDLQRALAIPKECKIPAPPIDDCSATGSPSIAPAPVFSPTGSPSMAPAPGPMTAAMGPTASAAGSTAMSPGPSSSIGSSPVGNSTSKNGGTVNVGKPFLLATALVFLCAVA